MPMDVYSKISRLKALVSDMETQIACAKEYARLEAPADKIGSTVFELQIGHFVTLAQEMRDVLNQEGTV